VNQLVVFITITFVSVFCIDADLTAETSLPVVSAFIDVKAGGIVGSQVIPITTIALRSVGSDETGVRTSLVMTAVGIAFPSLVIALRTVFVSVADFHMTDTLAGQTLIETMLFITDLFSFCRRTVQLIGGVIAVGNAIAFPSLGNAFKVTAQKAGTVDRLFGAVVLIGPVLAVIHPIAQPFIGNTRAFGIVAVAVVCGTGLDF